MSDVDVALHALQHASGVDETFRAILAAGDASSQAMADHLADRTDTDAQQRIGLVRGPLDGARTAAIQRCLQDGGTGSEPAQRWLEAQRARQLPPLAPAAARAHRLLQPQAEAAWFGRWQTVAQQAAAPRPPLPDLQAREAWMRVQEEAWAPHLADAAEVATHIYGYRHARAELHGLEPLDLATLPNRVQRSTVSAMLDVASRARPVLQRYLRARSRLLGAPDTPLPVGVRHHPLPSLDAAPRRLEADVEQIIDAFAQASPDLASFARRAVDAGWVDAEPRPHKNPLATCMHWSTRRESRISMVHDGTAQATVTLAHELGHAYHAEVLYRRGPTPVELPIALAETASLVAEGLVRSRIGGDDERSLLDDELAGATKWLLDAGQTLELERGMLARRAQGPLDANALTDLCASIAQEWFGPLAHPPRSYWASQFMLYLPGQVGLALPYLLAYLFASRVLAHSDQPDFPHRWAALLLDAETGSMEELALRHLQVDLSSPSTWTPVLDGLQAKTERFESLCRG